MLPTRPVAALCAVLCATALFAARDADAQNRARAAQRPSPRTRVAALERVLSEAQARTEAAVAGAEEAKARAEAATTRAEAATTRATEATTRAERAETRATEAQTRANRAERRATEANQRATEATQRAERAERRATESTQRAERTEQRANEATTRANRAERRATEATQRAERAEARARDLEAALAARDDAAAQAEAAASEGATPTSLATLVRSPSDDAARPEAPADATGPARPALPAGRALAALTSDACLEALRAQGVAFDRLPDTDAPGVTTPIRLRAPLAGIRVAPSNDPENSPHAVLDCRLALALVAWAPVLRAADVVAVEHYSAFRANARVGGSGPVSGHASGLALDAARLHLANGEVADVLADWGDRTRGDEPCTPRDDEAPRARLLRGVVCAAVAADLFQIVITPHHDAAHQNHVHLELRPGVDWSYVH
jgi:hypothetical protein